MDGKGSGEPAPVRSLIRALLVCMVKRWSDTGTNAGFGLVFKERLYRQFSNQCHELTKYSLSYMLSTV